MIETVLEVLGGMIVLTGGAGIAAAASGKGDKTMSTQPKAPPPRPPEDLFDPFLAALESQVRENARLYAAVPTASWLAPDEIDARFAPAPVAERPIPEKYQAPIVLPPPPPPCPSCGHKIHGTVEITAEHNGEPSMWRCQRCNTEYTKAGETKGSKKRRKAANVAFDLPLPPNMGIGRWFDSSEVSRPGDPRTLPCGCPGSGPIGKHSLVGCRFTTCDRCEARWYPPSNDPSGRRLAQGEAVHYANGTIGD